MVMVVAGGIAPILDVVLIILHLLGDSACEVAFTLFGDDIGDIAFPGFEIVAHCARLIFTAVILEHWFLLEVPHTVKYTHSMYLTAVHVHADLRCFHVDVAIVDGSGAVHGGAVLPEHDD